MVSVARARTTAARAHASRETAIHMSDRLMVTATMCLGLMEIRLMGPVVALMSIPATSRLVTAATRTGNAAPYLRTVNKDGE